MSTIYNRHQLLVEDTEEDEDGEFHAPIQMGENDSFQRVEMKVPSNEKVVFFSRGFAFHLSAFQFVNKHYLKDEEVLLNCEEACSCHLKIHFFHL